MIALNNEFLEVKIAEQGAELKSILFNGTQYIWHGDPEVWGFSCPLLFPICGGLKDDKYVYNGKQYSLQKHGFARKKTFVLEKKSDSEAVFLLKSDAETINSYPFKFELRVIFSLSEKSVKIDYLLKNLEDTPMYFNIGSHEGYFAPDGVDDFDIIFPLKETLSTTVLDGNMLTDNTVPVIENSSVLPLKEDYFKVDALVFTDIKSRSLILKNRKTEHSVKIDFPDDKYLLLWQKYGAPFICVEPWNGIPDTVGSGSDITQKFGITKLAGNGEFTHTHSITIIK